MSLQVRVRHALGERLFDAPDRSSDNPFVIGRSKDADIKIPSATVASRHSALFVHEGQWMVRDLSKGSTYLNGKSIQRPMPLSIGDVVALGNDASPATIEIDPAGAAAGQAGKPAVTNEPAPARQPQIAPAPRVAPAALPRLPQAKVYSAPRATPPQIIQPAQAVVSENPWATMGAAPDDPFAGWQPPAGASPALEYAVRRRRKKTSLVGWIAGILLCAIIVAGTIWAVRYEMHLKALVLANNGVKGTGSIPAADDAAEPAPTPVKPVSPDGNESSAKPIPKTAGDHDVTASAAPPVTPVSEPSAATRPSHDASAAADDAKQDDKEWNGVLSANYSADIGRAILQFDDYRRRHPGVATKDLDEFTEQAMDRLWWKRIVQLCTRRDARNKDLRAKDKELKEQPEGAFHKTLVDERKTIQDDLDRAQQQLAGDMGYTNADAPDQDNKEMMSKLTGERDAGKYGAWKISTLKYIRNNHGATPWDGEN